MKISNYLLRYRTYYTKIYFSSFPLGAFKLGDTLLPPPIEFSIEPIVTSKKSRTASGKLVVEKTIPKNRFILRFKYLSQSQTLAIRNEVSRQEILTFEYLNQSTTVICNDPTRQLLSATPELWKSITLELEEV
jgi:hypothetical protein